MKIKEGMLKGPCAFHLERLAVHKLRQDRHKHRPANKKTHLKPSRIDGQTPSRKLISASWSLQSTNENCIEMVEN